MLNSLRNKNPELTIYSVHDDEFKKYGTVIKNIDPSEIIKVAEGFCRPTDKSAYSASVPEFEALNIAKEINSECFGGVPSQLGYCDGRNSFLNALEWHICDEINIAVTDLVLILAKREDLDEKGCLDSSVCKVFFVPKGCVIEVFSDTLHYCPCEVSTDGFGMVVALSEGTNTPLDSGNPQGLLRAKNKWLLAHCDCEELTRDNAVVGVFGENIEIKY